MLLIVLLLSLFIVIPAVFIYSLCKTSARADQRAAEIQAHLDGERQDLPAAHSTTKNNHKRPTKLMGQRS